MKENKIIIIESEKDTNKTLQTLKKIKQNKNCVYISFQRPKNNLTKKLQEHNITKTEIIDIATKLAQEKEINLNEIITETYKKIKNKNTIIYIDSLTLILLYKPLSELLRLTEALINLTKKENKTNLVITIPKEQKEKNFIKNIATKADKIIKIR